MGQDSRKTTSLVGQYLRQKREAVGLSQKALGQRFEPKVTTQFISNVERGVTPLPAGHIPTLVRELKIDESELLVILERDYAQKLADKLQRQGLAAPAGEESATVSAPLLRNLLVEDRDAAFIRAIYQAYSLSDAAKREQFAVLCEKLFNVTRSG